jgi:predicted NUDIX family phosphoesterase
MDERILVIERGLLFDGVYSDELAFLGVNSDEDMTGRFLGRLHKNFEIMRRGDAEDNPQYKQPIPYVIVKSGDKIFVYKRLGGSGETRLVGRSSIGVGGHMNYHEGCETFLDQICENAYRELNEELNIDFDGEVELSIIGTINDDRDDVGKVHFGILAVATFPEGTPISVWETDQLEGQWMTLDEIKETTEVLLSLETWSQMAVLALW